MHHALTLWEQTAILGYVALAMLLGGVIGFERQISDKPAGMRTHMLVAGAAALLVALGNSLVLGFEKNLSGDAMRVDPLRIFEAVVTGVSFLGAGTIIRRGNEGHVEGLTTAASLLFTAATGICVALSHFVLAGGVTLLALITLRALRRLETWVDSRRSA